MLESVPVEKRFFFDPHPICSIISQSFPTRLALIRCLEVVIILERGRIQLLLVASSVSVFERDTEIEIVQDLVVADGIVSLIREDGATLAAEKPHK